MLTLSEKSYLLDILQPYTNLSSDDLWDLLDSVTSEQRALLIAMNIKKETGRIKELLNNIIDYAKAN